MLLDSRLSRRRMLQLVAGGAAMTAGFSPAGAAASRIPRLIEIASVLPEISRRIDFISRALIGTRYRGHTLIGGPDRPEQFVVRDDGFDCVTFCETVLAAALVHEADAFAPALRNIRYRNGNIQWRDRNHYYFEWCERNIANGSCRAIDLPGAIVLEKTVNWHRALGRRRFTMRVVPRAAFLASKDRLMTGDIVGFVTRRPNLDYFHTGFVAFGRGGAFLLRHASQSQRRVVDEPMERFIAVNRVRYVTLLRPLEPPETLEV